MKKITNVEALEMVLAMDLSDELRAKIETMKASFERKRNAKSGPTKTQVENESIKDEIVVFLGTVEKATITDIMKGLEREISNQKVSALVRQLIQDEKVVRFEEKRKAFFKLA